MPARKTGSQSQIPKQKGISRIDSGSTHGWFVRGYRNGKTYSKLFSDRKWGSKKAAHEAAQQHRTQLLKELAHIPQEKKQRRLVFRDARNSSGVIGVCRTSKKSASGKTNECYSVSWRPEPGVQKCTSFSIRKYGEKKAFQLAVAYRKERLREIYGNNVLRQINQKQKEKAK